MEREDNDMDVETTGLTPRQRVFQPAVICLIRAHTRRFPITSEQLCDLLNFYLAGLYPGEKPYGIVKGTDIRDIARHCRSLPWPETIPICSDAAGYYWGYESADFEPYLHHMGGRLRAIARATRPMTSYQQHLRIREASGDGQDPQGTLFDAPMPPRINLSGPPPRAALLAILHESGGVNSFDPAGRTALNHSRCLDTCLFPDGPSSDISPAGDGPQLQPRSDL
jgi:hypothetical protein